MTILILIYLRLGLSEEEEEVWLLVRVIRDPEHPFTLSQLRVVSPSLVKYERAVNTFVVQFKPTIPNCSLSSIIGLSIRVRILCNYVLDPPFKLVVRVADRSHDDYELINKQLLDKERIAGALEKSEVARIIRNCIQDPY